MSVPEDERPEVAALEDNVVYEFTADAFAVEAGAIMVQTIG